MQRDLMAPILRRVRQSGAMSALAGLALVGACGDGPTPPPTPRVASLTALSPITQTGPVGSVANFPPAVRALTAAGNPVGGVDVTFRAEGDAGAGVTVRTTNDGVATLTPWPLGAVASVLTMTESYPEVAPVEFTATVVQRQFDIVFRVIAGDLGASGNQALVLAEQKLESIIFGELPDAVIASVPVCASSVSGNIATLDETVDDVLILVRIRAIDGLGGGAAFGHPCLIRDPGAQTAVGRIELDSAEWVLSPLQNQTEILLHEAVHALGFANGVLNRSLPSGWSRECMKLPSRANPDLLVQDTHLSCPNARAAFDALGGGTYPLNKVPLENGGAIQGTQSSLNNHWRETTFSNELMSAYYQTNAGAPFSLVTVRLLQDLGYEVTHSAADPFQLSSPIPTLQEGPGSTRSWHGEIAPDVPVQILLTRSRN